MNKIKWKHLNRRNSLADYATTTTITIVKYLLDELIFVLKIFNLCYNILRCFILGYGS